MKKPNPAQVILVTGDCIWDHNFYKGDRDRADSESQLGFRVEESGGGALLLNNLVKTTVKDEEGWVTELGLEGEFDKLPKQFHAYCLWEPHEKDAKDKKSKVWRTCDPPFGYGEPELQLENKPDKEASKPPAPVLALQKPSADPSIIVIDDAGLNFRRVESKSLWPLNNSVKKDTQKPWVVLKISAPIAENDLWEQLILQHKEKLVVIVSADQIRRDDVRLSRGLSWEATVADLTNELSSNPRLATLLEARHLIITFRSDAAYWLDNSRDDPQATLVFDSANAEGEWEANQSQGGVFGYQSCFASAIVYQLTKTQGTECPEFEAALVAGLGASRELWRLGHGPVTDAGDPKQPVINREMGFPFAAIAAKIKNPTEVFVACHLPSKIPDRTTWMMLDEWQHFARVDSRVEPHHKAAKALALDGPKALSQYPIAKFGKLVTVDRGEIESLRTLREQIRNYQKGGVQKKPLSIGVFGPPGAGKSFGVTQIAESVLGKAGKPLTFNLSQFSTTDDLNGALHQVRDRVLSGETPLVFWDEFDSQNYRWLQYLLAPMQDGTFQDGQINHPVGKCIFVFAGATSATFQDFGPVDPSKLEPTNMTPSEMLDIEHKWQDFVLKKGPDFMTRLVSFLNVLGPNQRKINEIISGRRKPIPDSSDKCCPLRRALFIRSQFNLGDGVRLEIDQGLLTALLEIEEYKSGSRSLEFICQQLQQHTTDTPRRSRLPGQHLLNMHVDAERFWEICERERPIPIQTLTLAMALNLAYIIREDEREPLTAEQEFEKLTDDHKSSNRAQALRIPENLRLVGLSLVPGPVVSYEELAASRSKSDDEMQEILEKNIDFLAEAEHNGWMEERMDQGWKYSRIRKNELKRHDLLIPYVQLSEVNKGKDRKTIIGAPAADGKSEQFGYVDVVKLVGLRVVKSEP